jgi:hypothetical protein
MESARAFRERRIAAIQSGRTWAPLLSGPTCVIHVIPVESMAGQSVDVLKIHGAYHAFYFRDWGGASRTLNLDGVVVHTARVDGNQVPAYTQVFRNGAVEALRFAGRTVDERKVIPGLTVAAFVKDALEKFLPALAQLGVTGPVIIGVSLLGTAGYEFGGGLRYDGAIPPADRPDLVLPEVWLESLEQPPNLDQLAKQVLDVLWQCFDREQCPYFDASGNFVENV